MARLISSLEHGMLNRAPVAVLALLRKLVGNLSVSWVACNILTIVS